MPPPLNATTRQNNVGVSRNEQRQRDHERHHYWTPVLFYFFSGFSSYCYCLCYAAAKDVLINES